MITEVDINYHNRYLHAQKIHDRVLDAHHTRHESLKLGDPSVNLVISYTSKNTLPSRLPSLQPSEILIYMPPSLFDALYAQIEIECALSQIYGSHILQALDSEHRQSAQVSFDEIPQHLIDALRANFIRLDPTTYLKALKKGQQKAIDLWLTHLSPEEGAPLQRYPHRLVSHIIHPDHDPSDHLVFLPTTIPLVDLELNYAQSNTSPTLSLSVLPF